MNSDFSFLLLSVGAALVAGVVLGLLVAALYRRGVGQAAPGVRPVGDEILRIDADPAARKLVLRVSGLPVADVDSIADAEVRGHVRALMKLLASERDKPAAPAGSAPASPAPLPAATELRADVPAAPPPPEPAVLSPPAPAAPDDLSAPFLTRLATSLRPQAAAAPLKPAPAPAARTAKDQAAAQPPAEMFEQINAILQRKLAAQPHPPDIELYADEGELRILVGSEIFRRVEDVTDEHARGWIREAVAEWEAG